MPIHATGLYSVYVYIQYTYILLPSIHRPIDIMDYGVYTVHLQYIKVRLLYSPPNPSSPPTSRVSMKTRPASVCFIHLYLFLHLLRHQGCPWKPDLPVCVLQYSPIFISSPTPTSRVSKKTRPVRECPLSIIILVDLFLHLLRNQRCPENQISKKVFIRKLKIRSTPPPPTVH